MRPRSSTGVPATPWAVCRQLPAVPCRLLPLPGACCRCPKQALPAIPPLATPQLHERVWGVSGPAGAVLPGELVAGARQGHTQLMRCLQRSGGRACLGMLPPPHFSDARRLCPAPHKSSCSLAPPRWRQAVPKFTAPYRRFPRSASWSSTMTWTCPRRRCACGPRAATAGTTA